MTTNVSLTPELERFARECVDGGRYGSISEVMRSALRLLKEQQERHEAFVQSLKDPASQARDLPEALSDL
jgi:antitoxin ParD1/3/4